MKRLQAIDLARGFAVLTLTPVHALIVYGSPAAQEFLGAVFFFLAEGPGAQLFMLLMGISFVISSKKSGTAILKRAIIILFAGYLLNIFKFVIPMLAGAFPESLLHDLNVENNAKGLLLVFLIGDILQFAAPVLILLFVICRLPFYQWWSLGLALVVCFASPYMWDLQSSNFVINYLFQLIGGLPPRVFFPLFPWLTYPLIGVFIGHYLKAERMAILKWIALAGIPLLFLPFNGDITFYRTPPFETLVHLEVVLLWLYLWHLLSSYVPNNYFFTFLIYLSRRVTSIYFIQWIVILWLVPFMGYNLLDSNKTIYCIIGITALVLGLQKVMDFWKEKIVIGIKEANYHPLKPSEK